MELPARATSVGGRIKGVSCRGYLTRGLGAWTSSCSGPWGGVPWLCLGAEIEAGRGGVHLGKYFVSLWSLVVS